MLGGGGASTLPRDARAFAKSPAECVEGTCGLEANPGRNTEASAVSWGVDSRGEGGTAPGRPGPALLPVEEVLLLRRKGL